MSKLKRTVLKTIAFILGWILFAGLIPIPDVKNPVIWRLFAEIVPLLGAILFTVVFYYKDRKEIRIPIVNSYIADTCIGLIVGLIWIAIPIAILLFLGNMEITGRNYISNLWIWILAAFLNVIMQELVFRGYIYQLIKKEYNVYSAAIVTTILFTAMHGGAFEAGVIPVLNVITMSLFMTSVLEYTKSLLAPIIMHAVWNIIGAIIIGGVSLAEDYPNLFTTIVSGNTIISGGAYKIEGSIIVLVLNLIFFAIFVALNKKKNVDI